MPDLDSRTDDVNDSGSGNQRVTNVKLKSQINDVHKEIESVNKDVRAIASDVSALRADLAVILTYKEVSEERWEAHRREHKELSFHNRAFESFFALIGAAIGVFIERP